MRKHFKKDFLAFQIKILVKFYDSPENYHLARICINTVELMVFEMSSLQ
jgi:hypothetical protein